ncbi:hypothetical protein AJ88_18515 [Mesorhizobium amorphae CCBAU 01583]|nr:hypothetical protein AJ88_18515 [Mesorhizobium amorphae CCBAU 01583]
MVDHLAGLANLKAALTHAPFRAAGQRNVDLLGNVMVVGIDDARPKDQQAGRDLIIDEMAARAEHLQPAIFFQECRAEIGHAVGLPPAEFVPAPGQQPRQRTGVGRSKLDDTVEVAKARQRMRRHARAGMFHSIRATASRTGGLSTVSR